jgi:DNA (cytosine-5)-methyltransferase 1
MRFGSVCSGIEAASVAWHPLGWEAAWLSEIEPFPCAVLKHHYPDVPNHGDMTLLPEKILSGEVEAPDLFCGGTPCQAFSVAGLRNSLDDARGNLSLTFVGIANAIDHVRSVRRDAPAIIFWENVPGVLNTKDNAFGCFLGALAGENDPIIPPGDRWTNAGCVYGPQRTVAWRVLDAQYFGVAQRRRRVFVVASARDDFDPAEVLFEFEGVRRDIAPSRQARKVTPTISSSGTGVSRVGFNCEDEWFIETPVVGAMDNECGGNKLTHQSVSNGHVLLVGVSPDGKDTVGTLMARDYKGIGNQDLQDGRGLVLEPTDRYAMTQPIPLNTMNLLGREIEDGRRGFGIGEAGDPSPTLTKNHSHAVAQPTYAIQGSMIGRNDNAGPQGDGINVELCFTQNTIDRHAVAIAPTLTASNDPSRSPQSTEVTNQVAAIHSVSMAVRRLTPVECERLQGFPDGYTNIPWRKAAESPDGPRYKALGNSWAVPVVRWIGQRIQERITT